MDQIANPPLLSVHNLTKRYPSFSLEDVSFQVEAGTISGFVGRNGAGKTTTLKCIMGAVHPTSGEISYFGLPFLGHEADAKKGSGFVLGAADYYETKHLRTIAKVASRFYPQWEEGAYEGYLHEFCLDPDKRIKELSQGMRVKFALALALSHGARLLILDEPTSGLDPLSRDELLDVFLDLADRGCGILFSTHITSDLDKCANDIIYIEGGRIIASESLSSFRSRFRIVDAEEARKRKVRIEGERRGSSGTTALVSSDAQIGRAATLDEIMTHLDHASGKERS